MPNPLPKPIQDAIVAAIQSGMSVADATTEFRVARRTIYYYLRRASLHSGESTRKGARPGPKSRLLAYRRQILRAQDVNPELSMQEICELLKLPVTPSTLSRTLAIWEGEKASTNDQISE